MKRDRDLSFCGFLKNQSQVLFNLEKSTTVDPTIFSKTKQLLIRNFSKTADEANCMVNEIIEKKIVDRFYSASLITDDNELKVSLAPYLDGIEKVCPPPEIEA